jgi:hypothetical protein
MTMIGLAIISPATEHGPTGARTRFVRIGAVTGLIGLAVLVPTSGRLEAAVWAQHDGAIAMERGDPVLALDRATAAVELDPGFVPGRHLNVVVRDRVGQIDAAIAEARNVVQVEDMAQSRLRLALLLEQAGRVREASAEIDQVAERLPHDPLVSLNAAAFSLRRGDSALAIGRLSDAYRVAPSLVRLRGTRELSAIVEPAYQRTLDALVNAGMYEAAIRLAAWRGDTPAARLLVESADEEGRRVASLALDAIDGVPGARDALASLAAKSPTRFGAAGWAWLAAVQTCDTSAAKRWQSVTRIATGSFNEDPGELVRVPEGWVNHGPPRYPRSIWGVVPVYGDVAGTFTWTNDLAPVCDR